MHIIAIIKNYCLRFYLLIFREKGREGKERERSTNVREKHQLVASHTCTWT